MKEQITGFILKCDTCGERLEGGDGGVMVFVSDDEVTPVCEAYDWKTTGQTHYCDNCQNNDKYD